ncbi:MAG: hypothetical protein ACXV8O_01520 [Methylobacter sp.]
MIKNGSKLIADERRRQIEQERYSLEHDDNENPGALATAAICYATMAASGPEMRQAIRTQTENRILPKHWPWEYQYWKPGEDDSNKSRIRELVKAGALIAAEIDRLQRQDNLHHLHITQ